MANQKSNLDTDLMIKLATSLDEESDRALAILAGSYLEYLLEEFIAFALKLDSIPPIARDFMFDDPDASLSTFSSKIEAASRMKLINDIEKRDLHLIRKIRNDFAHEFLNVSFDTTNSITNRCRELKTAEVDGVPLTPRERFKKTAVRLMVEILTKLPK